MENRSARAMRHRAGGLPRWSPPATGRRCARVLSLELSGPGRRRARDVVRVCHCATGHGARAADAVPAPHGARRPRCRSRASVPLRRRPRRQSRRCRASSTRARRPRCRSRRAWALLCRRASCTEAARVEATALGPPAPPLEPWLGSRASPAPAAAERGARGRRSGFGMWS